jgi:Tol biopolymer transport system component/DNA-binding winged helix-turn-helix (wHTH) protein
MTEHNSSVFRFEDIEVREREYSLTRSGETATVEPTAFRVLIYLLRNAGRLVTKDEIIHAVWHGSAVSDNSLTRAVATLRRLLGDNSREPRLIATVQTIGYKFLVPVETISANGAQQVEPPVSELRARSPYKDGGTPGGAGENSGGSSWRPALRWIVPVCGMALLLAAGAVYFMHETNTRAREVSEPPPFTATAKNFLALPGTVGDPALSPDGKQLAFIWRSDAQPHSNLFVQLIGADQRLQLTHNTGGTLCCADWSPDGSQIAFGRCDDNGGAVLVVPALGGPARRITDVICIFGTGFPRWSADSRTLLLADRCSPGTPRGIVAFSLESGERRCLTSPPPGGDDSGDSSLIMSPDRKTLAFVRTTTLGHTDIYSIDPSDRNLRQLTHDGEACGPVTWSPDGKYVVFVSTRPGPVNQWWRVPREGGPIEPATSYPAVGRFSEDGRRIAVGQGFTTGTTWQVRLKSPGGGVTSLKKITNESLFQDSPQLASDGKRLVSRSQRGGHYGLWISDIDGNDNVLITEPQQSFVGSPHWSPDAKWIAMDYRGGKHSQIYVVDSEGRNFHALTSGDYENEVPRWSRDGRSIYFSSNRTGNWQLWRRDFAAGHETQITDRSGISAFESYDGSMLYYAKLEAGGLWRRPVAGGAEELVSAALHVGYWGAFAVTEPGIYLLDADAASRPTILYYDFKTRRTKPVLALDHLPFPTVPTMTASRDGLILFFTQVEAQSELYVAERER